MKKIFGFICVLAGILSLSSCNMKDCNCYSSNQVTQNDSVVRIEVDTVRNSTRNSCGDFNVDEVMNMDSGIVIHHIMVCEEE